MAHESLDVSRRGKQRTVRSISLGPNMLILIRGKLLRIGEIHDELWIPRKNIQALPLILEQLICRPDRPDILTYAQKLQTQAPIYPYYYECDNLAVVQIETHKEWFDNQIARMVRKQIRKAAREGIRVEVVPFTDDFVDGICSIYNETPIRQGRKFWHYGKDRETVKKENGSYLDRSIFIGAFNEGELVGFTKIVFDEEVAMFMQILSKLAYFRKGTNDALVSKAIEVCEHRQAKYLIYGQYAYGKKERSSLIEFKKSLGFNKVEIPRYFVPLTLRGRAALILRLHRGFRAHVPSFINKGFIWLRGRFYRLRRKSL